MSQHGSEEDICVSHVSAWRNQLEPRAAAFYEAVVMRVTHLHFPQLHWAPVDTCIYDLTEDICLDFLLALTLCIHQYASLLLSVFYAHLLSLSVYMANKTKEAVFRNWICILSNVYILPRKFSFYIRYISDIYFLTKSWKIFRALVQVFIFSMY